MLRRGGERLNLLAAEGKEHAAGRLPERRDGIRDTAHLDPVIAGALGPGGAPQRQQLDASGLSRRGGIGRDHRRIRMRGVDQNIDPLVAEIAGEAIGAAEPAQPDRHGLRRGLRGAAGQRQRHGACVALGQGGGKLPRFAGAAKDEDIHGPR